MLLLVVALFLPRARAAPPDTAALGRRAAGEVGAAAPSPNLLLIRPFGVLPSWFDQDRFIAVLLAELHGDTRLASDAVPPDALSNLIDSQIAPSVQDLLKRLGYRSLIYLQLQPAAERLDVRWEVYPLDGSERALAQGSVSDGPAPPPPPLRPPPPPVLATVAPEQPPIVTAQDSLPVLPADATPVPSRVALRWLGGGAAALGAIAVLSTWRQYYDTDMTVERWRSLQVSNTFGWAAMGLGGAAFGVSFVLPVRGQERR